jgi:hypothetical protein
MDTARTKEQEAIEVLSAQVEQHLRANDLKIYIEAARALYLRDHGQAPLEESPAGLWFRWAEIRLQDSDPLGEGFRPWNGRAFRGIPGLFSKT